MSAAASCLHWASIGESTFVAGVRLLWAIHRVLGPVPYRLCACPVVFWYWATNALARRASLQYLQRLEAARGVLGHEPGWRDTLRHFFSFADTVLDKLLAASGRLGPSGVRVEGREAILGLRCSGRGAVIVTAHVGCLELCRALAGRDEERFPLTVLVHTRHAERFNRMLQRLDPHTQVELLQVTEVSAATSLMLAERIERGELVAIVGDRVPVTPSKTVRVPFLGHEAAFPVGAYVLAALLRCPLFFMGCVRQGRGHLVRFRPITGQVALPRGRRTAALAQLVQAYVQELEALLVQSPFEWFNFFPFWDQAPTFPDTSHVQDP